MIHDLIISDDFIDKVLLEVPMTLKTFLYEILIIIYACANNLPPFSCLGCDIKLPSINYPLCTKKFVLK